MYYKYKAMKLLRRLCVLGFLLTTLTDAKGQNIGLKTNLLYDATLTINAGVEVGLAPKWSFDLSINFNGWTVDGHKWKHWLA